MQIKRFEAQDMAEALKMIKQEFGPQAVILSARDISQRKGVFGWLKTPGVEVTAATDTHNHHIGKAKAPPTAGRKWTLQKERSAMPTSKMQMRIKPSHTTAPKRKIRYQPNAGDRKSQPQAKDELIRFLNLYDDLVAQGVEETLASEIIESLREITPPDEILEEEVITGYLEEALKAQGASEDQTGMPKESHRAVVLVGPTGVGKTTTMAKIAVAESFHKGKQIALITLNDHRIGATAQMEAYGKILGVPVAAASSRAELESSLQRFRDKDLILIDTPGISHNDVYGINELRELLEVIDASEVHLLIGAGTRKSDFDRIFVRFNLLPVHRLLFTKVDETDQYGSMLNALVRTKLPLSYLTNGQQVPENIEAGSISRLISLLWSTRKHQNRTQKRIDAPRPGATSEGREKAVPPNGYVANRNSDLFHHPYCKWVERIEKKNMLIFESRSEALANHFHPCRACHNASVEAQSHFGSAMGSDKRMRRVAG